MGSQVARILITPGAARDRLTAGAYVPRREDDVLGRMEFAMEAAVAAEPIEAKLRRASREGKLPQRAPEEQWRAAVAQGVITQQEHDHLVRTDRLRREVVKVDDFAPDSVGASQEEPWQQESRRRAAVASM